MWVFILCNLKFTEIKHIKHTLFQEDNLALTIQNDFYLKITLLGIYPRDIMISVIYKCRVI